MAEPALRTAPDELAVDLAALKQAIVRAPLEVRERLAPLFAPAAIRSARLAKRNELLGRMGVGLSDSAEGAAEAVHTALSRYAASTWRYERERRAPADQRHGLAHAVLRLNGGEVPSIRSLRRIFGRSSVAKKTDGNGHGRPTLSD